MSALTNLLMTNTDCEEFCTDPALQAVFKGFKTSHGTMYSTMPVKMSLEYIAALQPVQALAQTMHINAFAIDKITKVLCFNPKRKLNFSMQANNLDMLLQHVLDTKLPQHMLVDNSGEIIHSFTERETFTWVGLKVTDEIITVSFFSVVSDPKSFVKQKIFSTVTAEETL